MRSALPPRAVVSALLLAAVGALFVLKYAARATPHAPLLAAGIAVGYPLALGFAAWATRRVSEQTAQRLALVGAILLVGAAALAVTLTPDATRVARLPALRDGLAALADGRFPYGLHGRPSGFPGLFLFAAPFWAVGAEAFLAVAGAGLFLALAWQLVPEARGRLLVVAGLALLPSFGYEVLVRSELFANAALVLGSLLLTEEARQRGGFGPLVVAAVFVGLVLSTRLVVALPLALHGAFAFRQDWQRGLLFAAVAGLAFAATVVPFAFWEPTLFRTDGPFAVQGQYLPPGVAPAFGLAALGLGWTARDGGAVLFRAGVLLFALVALAFGLGVAADGLGPTLDGSRSDVAYFVFGTPFLLLALAQTVGRPSADATSARTASAKASTVTTP